MKATNFLKQTALGLKLFSLTMLFLVAGCKPEEIPLLTTSDKPILSYLEQYPEKYSEFIKMLDKTGYSGFLNAYGTYTCFVPNNDAVAAFLKAKNLSSVDNIPIEDLKSLVSFHVIKDTVNASLFTDGKLPSPTMQGQYLVTNAVLENNVAKVWINRQAYLLVKNIKVGNGLIHEIDNVLEPSQKTVAQVIEGMPGYSIFLQALKETGLYDTLNVILAPDGSKKWFTVIAQHDSVFQAAGFKDYDALKNKFSNINPKDPADSLNIFMQYRILNSINYVADLVSQPAHLTRAPLEVMLISLNQDTVKINEETFADSLERGVTLDRKHSDFSANNGVVHIVMQNYQIKIRKPTPVYWDLGDLPELRKMPNIFRKTGMSYTFDYYNQPADFKFGSILYSTGWAQPVYQVGGGNYSNGDYIQGALRLGAVLTYYKMKSPVIVKGKYKVWLCERRISLRPGKHSIAIDDSTAKLQNTFTLDYAPSNNYTDEQLEVLGYKRYTYANCASSNDYVGRYMGFVEFSTTARHWVWIIPENNPGATDAMIDMIHFIPVSQNQIWPKFGPAGRVDGPCPPPENP
jgi:uncharacterized surface protein with fasciclin (FAS1) repeats